RRGGPRRPDGWAEATPLDPERLGTALTEEPCRAEDEHGDEEDEVADLFPGDAEEVRAHDLHRRHDQASQHRPHHVAEAAQHDDDVGEEHELQPRRGVDGVERRHQRARGADARDADRERQAVDLVGIDAHQCRRVVVLRRGAHDPARVGPLHEGDVHAEHEELAVGEVDDTHDPEDQREADGDQGIDPPEEDRRDAELREDVYLRASQAPSGIHFARFVVNSSGQTVTSWPLCHWSMYCWTRSLAFWPFSANFTPLPLITEPTGRASDIAASRNLSRSSLFARSSTTFRSQSPPPASWWPPNG